MNITSIIIDDEPKARELLKAMLKEYCENVDVLALCENLPEGVKAIKKHQPNIVFLDIEMPGYNGLEILDFFNESEVDFEIIFTTAYNQFAIQAFKLSAIDYLLKPINGNALEEALNRYQNRVSKSNLNALRSMSKSKKLDKLSVVSNSKIKLVSLSDITHLKSEGSYTEIFLIDGFKLVASRNLKYHEDILEGSPNFFRCHKSYIINTKLIVEVNKSDGFSVIFSNGLEVPVSIQKQKELSYIIE